MAEKMLKKQKDGSRVVKKIKKASDSQMEKKVKERAVAKAFSLLADEKAIDPALSTLFAVKAAPVASKAPPKPKAVVQEDEDEEVEPAVQPQRDVSSIFTHVDVPALTAEEQSEKKRKRKRKDNDEDLEGVYLQKLAREEERDAVKRRKQDLPVAKTDESADEDDDGDEVTDEDDAELGAEMIEEDDENPDDMASPPKHETLQAADNELSKANRTAFLGNVSTTAISSNSARKTLIKHLTSFFKDTSKDPGANPKLESLRFRSTPYASSIPKKAAYARKEVMDATAKSSNAYAVYSSPQLAREAARRLNGTVVLERHLRVDEVAHPAKVDHKRCVFVGNLGFVDDESNIQQANEDEGREVRKRGKEPADVEEGLWRCFGKCGTVESVRVIRDSTTRVGKGIAYVQFEDENAVEAALLYNEKKFPPMLPRKLRVSRAKAVKRHVKPGSGRPTDRAQRTTGYQRKISSAEASQQGRVGKLFGKAAAAKTSSSATAANMTDLGPRQASGSGPTPRPSALGNGIRRPEDFVFEGHRASSRGGGGKSGLKLGGKKGGGNAKAKGKGAKGGKSGKPTSRSSKRGAAFKAGGGKKART
ncbi:hypothetical protein LTR62_004996 [Meristemomyces frigidus]|uniref:Nucleolar protein 12 n=1 Tax=Meristemomyces frigidus TaxID=1508187 RepID=A0AAN7TQW7_9PEZI|nr:hypothetical protein LTR62_004996 [Meristemomyces frigidus]